MIAASENNGYSTFNPRNFVSSDVKDEPSPVDLVEALGSDSKKFVNLAALRNYGLNNLPPKEAETILFTTPDLQSITSKIRDTFDGVTVITESPEQIAWLPTWEIHRPKIDGCTATLAKSSNLSTEFSLSVKVFGVGGGLSKSISVGYKESIEAAGECLQIRLPIKISIQECKTRTGEKFTRVNVKDILQEPNCVELKGTDDHCGLTSSQLMKTGWTTRNIDVPQKTTRQIDLNVQSSQAAELSLELNVLGATIGPKAVLKLQKELDYSYKLVGPHQYYAYFPKNSISYYWSLS